MFNRKKIEERSNKYEFFDETKKFFDAGVLSEIYSDDHLCVCNICNYTYGAFPYLRDRKTGEQLAFIFNSELLNKIMDDKTLVFQILLANAKGKADFSKSIIKFSDVTFNRLLELKKQTDLNGPGPGVNLEMEKEIIEGQKKK